MATKTYNIDINVQSKTLGQLEDQLSQVNEELKQVDRNSEAFKNLTKQAQVLNKEILKTNKEIEGFTMEKKIDAANGAAMLFSGTLNTVVGSLGLLGIESEKFGEFEKKAASAIAAGIGVKDMVEGLSKVGPVFASAGKAALKFARTTKGAIIATGVGAFVVLVGTLIANWDKVTKAIENFAAKVPIVGKAVNFIKGVVDKLNKSLQNMGLITSDATLELQKETAAMRRLIEEQTAAGASADDLFKLKEQLIQDELKLLVDKGAKEEEIFDKYTELNVLRNANDKRLADEAEQRRLDSQAKEKADADAKLAAEEAAAESLLAFQQSFYEKERDLAATNEQEKITLEETRALEELERLGGTLEQRNQVIAYYNQLRDEAAKEQEEKDKEERDAKDKEDLDKTKALEEKKLQLKLNSLQTLSELFGQETALGKAALIAKQAILAQELLAEVKGLTFKAQNAATEATIDAAKAGSAIAAGAAETGKIGFPQNIPLLIGYAAQAVGIISAVKQATSQVENATGQGAGLSITNPNIPTTVVAPEAPTPQVQPAQPAVRAYVVAGDTRSAAEAEAKIQTRRTFGS